MGQTTIGRPPLMPRFEDTSPIFDSDKTFLQSVARKGKRGINSLLDFFYGSTPEEEAETAVLSFVNPLGTVATAGRRALRPALEDPKTMFRSFVGRNPSEDELLALTNVTGDWAHQPGNEASRRLSEYLKTSKGIEVQKGFHDLLRSLYPSGSVPLYRGAALKVARPRGGSTGSLQLDNLLVNILDRDIPGRGYRSFSTSPRIARGRFSDPNTALDFRPGATSSDYGVVSSEVPIESIVSPIPASHMLSKKTPLREEEMIVDLFHPSSKKASARVFPPVGETTWGRKRGY
jgi:hypothetical protein